MITGSTGLGGWTLVHTHTTTFGDEKVRPRRPTLSGFQDSNFLVVFSLLFMEVSVVLSPCVVPPVTRGPPSRSGLLTPLRPVGAARGVVDLRFRPL